MIKRQLPVRMRVKFSPINSSHLWTIVRLERRAMIHISVISFLFSVSPWPTHGQAPLSIAAPDTSKSGKSIESAEVNLAASLVNNLTTKHGNLLASLTSTVFMNATAPPRRVRRMVGGEIQTSPDWPKYYGFLYGELEQEEKGFLCGGAFITTHIFVTASNCFDLWNGYFDSLRVSDLPKIWYKSTPDYTSPVVGVYRYPIHKDENFYVDIALVQVEKPFDSNNLLELPYKGYDDQFIDKNKEVRAVGSGETRGSEFPKWIQRGSSGGTQGGWLNLSHQQCESEAGGFNSATEVCSIISDKSIRLCRYDEGEQRLK